jgi:hypothetical protein
MPHVNTSPPVASQNEAAPTSRALLRSLASSLLFMVGLCTAIALLLALLDGNLPAKLAYSFAIGMSCWALIDGMRLVVEAVRRRLAGPGVAAPPLGWTGVLPLVALGVLLGPPVGIALVATLGGNASPYRWDLGSRSTQITLAITLLATFVAMAVISAQERAAAQRERAEAAQRAAAEAQLRLLQSQLEPHMLFNTLANLRVLIGLDATRAQQMLDRLIAFLRATLQASRRPWHPLADEFARLEDYLALMAVRMGPRLQTRIDLPDALRAWPVPPLLLQPLVENAIKHGLEPHVDGGRLEVRAELRGAELALYVLDTGVGIASTQGDGPGQSAPHASRAPAGAAGTGFGLAQVRDRLRTLYGDAATLELQPAADGGTLACIRLPAPVAQRPQTRPAADAAAGVGRGTPSQRPADAA